MSSPRLSSTNLLCVLSFALVSQVAFGANPLFHFCSNSDNFTSYSPYQTNLDKLVTSLFYKTPTSGFSIGSVGQPQEKANGLALCRGDVNSTDCKVCVVQASGEIRRRCPNNKGAIIWYDDCLVKYSDTDFFGKIDDQNMVYLYNVRTVSDPVTFNENTKKLLSQLSEEAYVRPKLYATGELELGEAKTLYGLVQCTRDLSEVDCKRCLDGAINRLPNCCDGKEGGRVIGGSCNFRYEIYPFVKY